MPLIAILSVLGIGVADRVRTSTFGKRSLIFSFCATPKRCSSSTISRPKSLNLISEPKILCVPTNKSTLPKAKSLSTSFCLVGETKRLSISILTGNASILFFAVLKCCIARTVVGTRIAHCFPSPMHLNAALSATSVLPKPTSPHSSLSIGALLCISLFISSMERS